MEKVWFRLSKKTFKVSKRFFLVPTRWRGQRSSGTLNEVTSLRGDHVLATRQRRVIHRDWTLARPEWVTTPLLREPEKEGIP